MRLSSSSVLSFSVSSFALVLAVGACTGDAASSAADPSPSAADAGGTVTPAPSGTGTTPKADAGSPPPAADAGTPPVAEWTPKDLGSLAVWLRGDLGVHTDAASVVTHWDDQSGQGNNAAPVMGAEPVAKSGALASLEFAGTQMMTIKDSASVRWSSDFTVVVVASSSQKAKTYGALYGKSAVAYPYAGPALFTDYPGGKTPYVGAVGGQIDIGNFVVSTETALDDQSPRMFGLRRSGAMISMTVNGGAPSTQMLMNPTDTSATGVDAFIGGHPNAAQQGFVGSMYEVIGVSAALDDASYAKVTAYVTKRYGIK